MVQYPKINQYYRTYQQSKEEKLHNHLIDTEKALCPFHDGWSTSSRTVLSSGKKHKAVGRNRTYNKALLIHDCNSHNNKFIIKTLRKLEIEQNFLSLKRRSITLTSMAQLVGHRPIKQKVTHLMPGQGTCLGFRFGPQTWHVPEATDGCFSLTLTLMFLFLCFSLPSPLSKSK